MILNCIITLKRNLEDLLLHVSFSTDFAVQRLLFPVIVLSNEKCLY